MCPMNNNDKQTITLKTKPAAKGYDGHRTISVRMTESLFVELESLAGRTNRSRNELINLLLAEAVRRVKVED